MNDFNYHDAETALLIIEQVTLIKINDLDSSTPISLNCTENGIQAERDTILSIAAPKLNKAMDNHGEELSRCCFDIEIIEDVMEYINTFEDGLLVDQSVWDKAYT
jgi:hypothetical protein